MSRLDEIRARDRGQWLDVPFPVAQEDRRYLLARCDEMAALLRGLVRDGRAGVFNVNVDLYCVQIRAALARLEEA